MLPNAHELTSKHRCQQYNDRREENQTIWPNTRYRKKMHGNHRFRMFMACQPPLWEKMPGHTPKCNNVCLAYLISTGIPTCKSMKIRQCRPAHIHLHMKRRQRRSAHGELHISNTCESVGRPTRMYTSKKRNRRSTRIHLHVKWCEKAKRATPSFT